MPDIVLMIDVWVVLGHAAADGHMTVCCNPADLDPFALQQFSPTVFSIALDDDTSDTSTTLNATTFPVSSSIKV